MNNGSWRLLMIALLAVSGWTGWIFARRISRIPMPSVIISGSIMPKDTWPEWERVLSSAARLQRILPEAVLVQCNS